MTPAASRDPAPAKRFPSRCMTCCRISPQRMTRRCAIVRCRAHLCERSETCSLSWQDSSAELVRGETQEPRKAHTRDSCKGYTGKRQRMVTRGMPVGSKAKLGHAERSGQRCGAQDLSLPGEVEQIETREEDAMSPIIERLRVKVGLMESFLLLNRNQGFILDRARSPNQATARSTPTVPA